MAPPMWSERPQTAANQGATSQTSYNWLHPLVNVCITWRATARDRPSERRGLLNVQPAREERRSYTCVIRPIRTKHSGNIAMSSQRSGRPLMISSAHMCFEEGKYSGGGHVIVDNRQGELYIIPYIKIFLFNLLHMQGAPKNWSPMKKFNNFAI